MKTTFASRCGKSLHLAGLIVAFGLAAPFQASAHRVKVSTPAAAQMIVQSGGQLLVDYGSSQLYEVNTIPSELLQNDQIEVRDDYTHILLNAGQIDTASTTSKATRKSAGGFAGKHLHLIQFVGPVQAGWHEQLRKTGVTILDYIPQNTYLVYGDAGAIAKLQGLANTFKTVQWDGVYQDAYKIHPSAKLHDEKGVARQLATDLFAIQLVNDPAANKATLAVIDKLKLEPIRRQYKILQYVNVNVRLHPQDLATLAAQPDVISILPYATPQKHDERQDQIIAGNLSGSLPAGPGYLTWLATKGFTQSQFTTSGFAVDLSDSGIDDGTTAPGHFALYTLGNTNNASRVVYNRLEGSPNAGSTLQGCDGHGNINSHIISAYDAYTGFPHTDSAGYFYDLGVCPFVRVGSSVIFDPTNFTSPDYADLMSRAYHDGSRISNNSWGSSVSGAYDSDAQAYDALVRDAQPAGSAYAAAGNQEMVIVFSAGNDGPALNSVSSPATGKNVIAVGGAENVRSVSSANGGDTAAGDDGCATPDTDANSANDIVFFASRGPCADGRSKPDLVAPASHVTGGAPQNYPPAATSGTGSGLSCFLSIGDNLGVCGLPAAGTNHASNFFPEGQQFFTISSGTSHSAPSVAGACALLRQYFINQSSLPPSPAMTKVYLMNSTRYMTGSSANDSLWSVNQGMGELNLGMAFDGVARVLRDELPADKFTGTGQTRTFTGVISDPTKPFRVTLGWTDAPGSTTGNALNNDLDLTVNVAGKTYKGNVFSGAYSATGGSADHLNNVESVFLPAGVTGNFTVTITAANINSDGVPGDADLLDQDFALVIYNGLTVPEPNIVAAGSQVAGESCLPTNGAVDPGETVAVTFTLANVGNANTTNLVGTLQATGGVTGPSGPQVYGSLIATGASVSETFTFTAAGKCGGTMTNTLVLTDGSANLGTVTYLLPLGARQSILAEDFDGVSSPTLPSGWATISSGAESPWVTTSASADTAPNAAFSPDPSAAGVTELDSPPFVIHTASAQLVFRHAYGLEASAVTPTIAYDGGVLEIKIGKKAYVDILKAKGSFVSGGYNRVISKKFGNPLRGRAAWSGNSPGFVTTIVKLPPKAAGQTVQFRWRCGSDNDTSSTGWLIDSISVVDPNCCTETP